MMKHSRYARAILGLFVMLVMVSVCTACPTCKDGIAEGPQHTAMVRGYFWSIVFMMSMPFLIFGSLGAYFYYQVRQARSAQEATTIAGHAGDLSGCTSSEV